MSAYRRNYDRERDAGSPGDEVWSFDFSYRRIRCRGSGFATKAEAILAESKARERLVAQGRMPIPRTDSTFAKVCQQFIASRKLTRAPKTVQSEVYKARQVEKFFGSMIVSRILPFDITQYRDKRLREGVANRTANLELIFIRCVLDHAIEQGNADNNPARGIKLLREVKRDKPIPLDAQLQRLMDEAEKTTVGHQLVVWIWLLALTGLRPSEAFHLEWPDIDFDARKIYVRPKEQHALKTGKFRVIEIHEVLLPTLQQWLRTWEAVFEVNKKGRTHNWVFFNPRRQNFPVATFAKAFEDARDASGLNGTGITPYSLRHYFISKAIMSGIDLFTITKWSGHSSTTMIEQVYGHLTPEFRSAQMAKIHIAAAPAESQSSAQPQPEPKTQTGVHALPLTLAHDAS